MDRSAKHIVSQRDRARQSLNDDTKILTENDAETFFSIPNFRNRDFFPRPNSPKLKPILFSETKFSESKTETFFPRPNSLKPSEESSVAYIPFSSLLRI